MRRIFVAVATGLLSLVFVSCGTAGTGSSTDSISGTVAVSGTTVTDHEWKTAYESHLDHIYKTSKHPDHLHYFVRNIDQKEAPELFVYDYGADIVGDELTVYTYMDDSVRKTGSRQITGTTRLLYSEDPSCPGVFTFDVGGGLERYAYMTLQDGKLLETDLWNEDYSGISKELGKNRERIEETSSDKRLIGESKKVYKNNQDIENLKMKAENKI